MTGRDIINDLARSTKDPTFLIISEIEWLDIINSEGESLSPDVLVENSTNFTWATASEIDTTNYAIDLSSTTYDGIEEIKDIYLVDSNGKKWIYYNWVYDKIARKIDLDPDTKTEATIVPGEDYPTININWLNRFQPITIGTTINLKRVEMNLLRKLCIKEGLQRILLDHIKLDRYRTLVARSNEYTLLAMIKNFRDEITEDKRSLNNINSVRSF